uniref:Cellular repressor of E1A-stimulated genes 1 n=1 Tax=Cyprinus carpio TaxID=7962 RepID=A0A8C2KGW0_CYPCA
MTADRSLLAVCVALVAALGGSLSVPPHEKVARMARFVVNKCDWASMPFSNAFSISDGPAGNGTGTPYLYLTHLEISVQDLQVQISADQSDIQTDDGVMVDLFQVNGSEASVAKAALFSRHPEMIDWPADHNWFFAKMNITQVWVLDYFGGVKTITPEEYYRATPYQKHNGESCRHDRASLV